MNNRKRAMTLAVLTVVLVPAFAAMATPAFADGGHFSSVDFAAATPGTYDIVTGNGGSYGDGGGANVVESLEPDDFICNQRVVFFTLLEMLDGAPVHTITVENEFDRESTSGVQVGYDGPAEVSVVDLDGTSTLLATLTSFDVDTLADELIVTAVVAGLSSGEAVALRHEMNLECNEPPPASGGGNIHADINSITELLPDVGSNVQAGEQDIPLKPNIPAQVAAFGVDLGLCVGEIGSSSTSVTANVTPSDGGTIDIFDSNGDPVANNLADGESVDLPPGDYTWEADVHPLFDTTGDTSGAFTVEDCSLEPPGTAGVVLGACVGTLGSSETPATVVITPPGAGTVDILDSEGNVVGDDLADGDVVNLAPGTYTWVASIDEGFDAEGATTGTLEVEDCSLTPEIRSASVDVDLGPCVPATGSSEVTLTVNPDEAATITVRDPDGDVLGRFDNEDSIDVQPAGEFTWSAVAAEGFELEGDDGGTFAPESCVLGTVETEDELAATGASVWPIGAAGSWFFIMGWAFLAAAKRRATVAPVRVTSAAGLAVVDQAMHGTWWFRRDPHAPRLRHAPDPRDQGQPPQRAGP